MLGMSVAFGSVHDMHTVHTIVGSMLNDLGVVAPIVIVAGGFFGVYQAAARIYNRTVGSRRDLARRLNQLAAGVTLRYVEERFGTPAFASTITFPRCPPSEEPVRPRRRPLRELALILADASTPARDSAAMGTADAREGTPRGRQPFRELVYREKHAWIQILVDDNDAVVRFSITVTDPRFKFSVRDLTWGHLAVRLGHSCFSDVQLGPGLPLDGRSLRIGTHNHEYAEAYWFGNPGNYQHYVISSNEIGTGEFGYSIQQDGPSWHRSGLLAHDNPSSADQSTFDSNAPYASRFRSQTTINTLTILGPNRQPAELAEPRGPASNHVRVLVPGRREWRQIRRRLSRMNRESLRSHVAISAGGETEDAKLRQRERSCRSSRTGSPGSPDRL